MASASQWGPPAGWRHGRQHRDDDLLAL